MRRAGHDYTPGFRQSLNPRGDIRRIAERIDCLACAGTDHDRSGIYPNPHCQLRTGLRLVELRDRIQDREARASCPFRVVLMGDRIAEKGHDAIADIAHHLAVEPRDCLRRCVLISGHRRTPLFRIDLRGERD
jgi:hypothetical protein